MRRRGAGFFQAARSRGLLRAGERGVLHGSWGRGEAQGTVLLCEGNPEAQDALQFSVGASVSEAAFLCLSATSVFSHPVGEGLHSSSPGELSCFSTWWLAGLWRRGFALGNGLDLAQEEDPVVTDTLTRAPDPGACLATLLRKGAVCMGSILVSSGSLGSLASFA